MKKTLLSLITIFVIGSVSAQTVESLQKESTENTKEISKLKNYIENSWMKNLKVSGYMQMQWQMAQEKGQNSQYNGGNFNPGVDNRFLLRRARLKVAYSLDFFKASVEVDASSSGVSLTEALIGLQFRSQVAGLSMGYVAIPYSYVVDVSSSSRMAPEIPRAVRALMPNDKALGGFATFRGKKGKSLNDLVFNIGVFSQNNFAGDLYSRKQLIARLQYDKKYDNIGFGFMGSFQRGGLVNIGEQSYTYSKSTNAFVENNDVQGKYNTSLYYDFGAKLNFKTSIGKTSLQGEYLFGNQPGTFKLNNTSKDQTFLASAGPVYNRKFSGYYVDLAHEFPKTNLSLLVRFDKYDPNRQISGNNVGLNVGTGAADLSYSTLGAGLCYSFLKDHLRLVAYYEFVWNETTSNLTNYTKNIKDNLFTLRLQAKF